MLTMCSTLLNSVGSEDSTQRIDPYSPASREPLAQILRPHDPARTASKTMCPIADDLHAISETSSMLTGFPPIRLISVTSSGFLYLFSVLMRFSWCRAFKSYGAIVDMNQRLCINECFGLQHKGQGFLNRN
jgi:hypothetical protein